MIAVRKEISWLICGVAALFLMVSGFFFGYGLAGFNKTSTSETNRSTATNKLTDEVVREVDRLAPSFAEHSLVDLENASHFGNFYSRTKALLKHLSQANIQSVQQMWEQSKTLQTPKFQEEVQTRVIQRWAVLDPVAAIRVVKEELPEHKQDISIQHIFGEWALSSLEDAIDFARTLDKAHRENAVSGMVLARDDLSVEVRREFARELDCELVATTGLKNSISDAVIEVPEQEWKLFVNENYEHIQHLSEEQFGFFTEIGHSWVLQEGVDVFAVMQDSLPDNYSLVSVAKSIADKLLDTHPQLALDFVLNGVYQGEETDYHEVAIELIARWADSDPNKALEATYDIEARSMRRQMQQLVLEKWATPDPYVLLDNLDKLPDTLQSFAHEIALAVLAKYAPETVAGKLGELPTRRNREKVAEALVSSWAVIDFSSTLQWIDEELLVAHKKESLKELAFTTYARIDPQQALETALQQPLKTNGDGWERDVIYEVILRDMDTAVAMMPRARSGETRYDTYDFGVMTSLFDSDFETASVLFIDLCDLESKAPNSIDLFARLAPERLFETLEVIRSVEARTEAARKLLVHYEGKSVFTDAQIALLQEIELSKRKELPDRISKRLRAAYDELREALEAEPDS